MSSYQSRKLAGMAVLLPMLAAGQNPIPGKFYEYYVVAKTGDTFTSLGASPSINDFRQVAFEATTSKGNGLWYGLFADRLTNFNPGESFASSDFIQPGVQINNNMRVVSEDRITTTSPATTSIRLYNAAMTDTFIYVGRGGPNKTYDAVFANPAVNSGGDVVFTAYHPSPNKVLVYSPYLTANVVERAIVSGNPKPMIADDGTVVIQVGGGGTSQSNQQIRVYPPGLGSPYIIADTNNHWLSLDNDPGISRDGRVVAFQGNVDDVGAALIGTTSGPGIFVAVDEGSGFVSPKIVRLTGTQVENIAMDRAAGKGNYDGACDAGENCKPAAELGFNSAGQPITIASYATDSRVGVANVDFGAAGIDDDTFVVSFVATPSEASRDNPFLPGHPLLFSAQQGLWTIRVDVTKQRAGTARVYHAYSPIPVIQIGDKLGADTITGLGVYDPIARAADDETAKIRTMRRGDHRVAFWASTNNGQVIVRANHLDSDQDGLLDHWETTGIDMDQDGTVDLKLSDYGADPFTRDLFLQVDWVGKAGYDLFKPAGGMFSADLAGNYSLFEANFRNAEVLSGALFGATIDGSPADDIPAGIVPHVDAGSGVDSLGLALSINLNGGAIHGGNYVGMSFDPSVMPRVVYFGQPGLTYPGVNVRAFQDIKDANLGAADKDARLLAFHYMVFAPFQDFLPNYPASPYNVSVSLVKDASHIEVNATKAELPAVGVNEYIMFSSGAADGLVRQINDVSVDGNTGKAIYGVTVPFDVLPAVGDAVVFLESSGGRAESAWAASPDNNPWPGNDVVIAPGGIGLLEGAPANLCLEAETVIHELGHTLGLMHGGTDRQAYKPADTYKSVMSYTWQLECNPTPLMPHYSVFGDNTQDDYDNLHFNFQDVLFHLTSTLGSARGEGYPSDLQEVPEMGIGDVIARDGSFDLTAPSVAIASPAAGAAVILGGNLAVTITATDNVQVGRVSVSFDTNGDGAIESGEAIAATQTGANTFQAVFSGVSGSLGTRPVRAIAWDTSSNSALATVNVTVAAPSPCDCNHDGATDIGDVKVVMNEALGSGAAAHYLAGNGTVTVADIQIATNAVLTSTCMAK